MLASQSCGGSPVGWRMRKQAQIRALAFELSDFPITEGLPKRRKPLEDIRQAEHLTDPNVR